MTTGGVTLPGGLPYEAHPHAELFPLMDGEAFAALTDDIREHGVREPIVLLDGLVLDGRNRYFAARECGAVIPTVEFTGADPLAFVISLNLKRRHLSETQRASVAAKIAKLPPGRPSKTAPIEAVSQERAAELMNVSRSATQRAAFVQDHGTPELNAAMDADQVSAGAAVEVARLPEPEQAEIVAAGPAVVVEIAAVQRTSLPDPAKAAQRKVIVAGAMRAGRGGSPAPRKSAVYEPNPARDAFLAVVDHCEALAAITTRNGATAILAQTRSAADRERLEDALAGANAAITNLMMEPFGAEQACA